MQLSRHTFRWMLVLTAIGSAGCLPSRRLTIPETARGTWHHNPQNAESASSRAPAKQSEPAKSTAGSAERPTSDEPDKSSRLVTAESEDRSPFQLAAYRSLAIESSAANHSAANLSLAQEPNVAEADNIGSATESAIPATGIPASGVQNPAQSISLEQFESIALSNNPTLRGMAATTQKAAGYRTQVGLWANPSVGYQGQQLADESTDQHLAFIEQEIVTGGKLGLNRRVLNEAVQAQLHELETQRMRILSDVRSKFYEALAAQQRIELIHDFQSVAGKGYELAELRKAALEGSQIDVLQAKVQKNEIDLAYQQAQIAYQAAWKELAALAGVTTLQPTRLAGQLPRSEESLNWQSVSATILSSSPEMQAAQARVRQARALLQRHGVQAIPNLTMQLGAGVDKSTDSGMINVQVDAPIPVFNQNQGNIAAARAEYTRALMDVARIENSIAARVAAVSQSYQSSAIAVTKYAQEILPNAEESMGLAEIAYKAGETNFIQVLIARRTYFDTTLQFISAQTELAQARAQVDGFVLSGGLDAMLDGSGDDSLRGLTFSQQ